MPDTTALPSSPARWFLGILAAFAIFALVGVYSSRMAEHTPNYDDDQAKVRYANLAKLQAADAKTLTTADWMDQSKGVVRIPIVEAMTAEVQTLKSKPVQMGAAIPGVNVPPAVPNTIPATNTPPADGAPAAPTAAGATAGKPAPSPTTSGAPAQNASPSGPVSTRTPSNSPR